MEKLWTTTEVANYLGVSEDDVERLVLEGQLTGYKLGGEFLRFRPDQVKRLKDQLGARRLTGGSTLKDTPRETAASPVSQGKPASPIHHPAGGGLSWQERVRDFVYFYDFYILSFFLLVGVMVYLMSAG